MSRDERRERVKELSDLGWSTPRIGRELGVDHSTVVRDLQRLAQDAPKDAQAAPQDAQGQLVERWRSIGPVAWCEGPYGWTGEDGQSVRLEPWQRAALLLWWDNRATCTTFAVSNVKKTGKTFCDAVLLCWRWLALPGQHFALANDLDQSQGRQFAFIAEMARRNPYLRENVRAGKSELVYLPTGSTLTALSNDAAGNAGSNHLSVSHTECWAIFYEAGIRAYEEMTPPPGKMYGLPALRICDSYAGFEGESVTWHSLVDRGLAGERVSKDWPIFKVGGLILFHAEGEDARERCFRGNAKEAAEYYAEQARTLRPNAFTRMHGNQRTAAESTFLPAGAWDACYDPALRPVTPGDKRRLIFGADASTTRDFTSLVGVDYSSNTNTTDLGLVKVWKPQRGFLRGGKPTVDLDATIGAEVLRLHKAGQIAAIVADPFQLHSLIIEWERAGIRVIELAQSSGRVEADQALYDTIMGRGLRHYGDKELSEAVSNAVAIETPRGLRLAKEKTSKKIDAAVALSMACFGALNTQKARGGGIEICQNPFYDCPPGEFVKTASGTRFVEAGETPWNFEPHPPGITWRNCPRSRTGCDACVEETRDLFAVDGVLSGPEDPDHPFDIYSDLPAGRRIMARLKAGQADDERRERVLETFEESVRLSKGVKNVSSIDT